MNFVIFKYAFIKLTNIRMLFGLLIFSIIAPALSAFMPIDEPNQRQLISAYITGPTVTMLISFVLVQDAALNQKSLNDGEYLALLFSRPVIRLQYIVSKWLANSIIVNIYTLLSVSCYAIAANALHRNIALVLSPYTFLDVFLNSISYTALVIVISAIPFKLGIWVYMAVLYSIMGISMTPMMSLAPDKYSAVTWLGNFAFYFATMLKTFVVPSVDTFSILQSGSLLVTGILTYASNLTLYILFASILLNKREFSYASE